MLFVKLLIFIFLSPYNLIFYFYFYATPCCHTDSQAKLAQSFFYCSKNNEVLRGIFLFCDKKKSPPLPPKRKERFLSASSFSHAPSPKLTVSLNLPRNGVVIGGENLRPVKSRCSPPKIPLFHLVFTDVNTLFVHVVNSPLFPEQQNRFGADLSANKAPKPCKGFIKP